MFSAAAYSSGGKNPTSTSSGLSSTAGTDGTKEAATPTTVRTNGAGTENRRDTPVTAVTTPTMATIQSAVCTLPVSQTHGTTVGP